MNEPCEENCEHCGLGLGTAPVVAGERRFCCEGCRTVYEALAECSLLAYYEQREGKGLRVQSASSEVDYLDDPAFLREHAEALGGAGHWRAEMLVEGLHCSACVWVIERLPMVLPGVSEARLSYADGRLEVSWDSGKVKLSEIARALIRFGYTPHISAGGVSRKKQQSVERRLLVRIGVAGAAFGNVMLLGLSLYSGDAHGMSSEYTEFFRWLSCLITIPSVLFTAQTFFAGAWAALRTRTPHMDLPISIGIAAALISGLTNTLRGSGEIYFDSVTMLVLLLLVGRWLQARQLDRARAATDLMLSLAPATARVVGADGVVEVATDSVERGAVVEVRSGERIGVDGIVLNGSSSVDASLLSGESRPLRVEAGSQVHAGSVNLTSRLHIRALCSGKETRLHAIVRDVARAARAKAPIVVFADRVSAYFVVVVLLAAVLTAVLAWPLGMEEALGRAVALLIVTCPCALGLATPLASSLALGQAARAGILIKGGRFLELLSRPGLFVFDKTGTLTRGTLSVVDWDGDKELSALVLAAEASSAHPIAQAFRAELCAGAAEASSALRSVPPAAHCEEVLGSGVRASIGGRTICVGSRSFVLAGSQSHAQGLTPALQRREQALLSAGLSPVLVSVDGQVRAIAGLGDPLREEAPECLSLLIQAGHRLALLSGDRNEIVHGVARRLGVPFEQVLGEQSPEQKLAFVEARCKLGPVFMVGDGVNDAAALSAAHVGIAVCGGAEASLAAADIFSTVRGLRPLVQLIQGSHSVLRLIHKNLVFSISYNIVAAALAITGLIHPVIAAVLMPLSSLTVVINTLRTRCFAVEPKVASDLQAQREQPNAPQSGASRAVFGSKEAA